MNNSSGSLITLLVPLIAIHHGYSPHQSLADCSRVDLHFAFLDSYVPVRYDRLPSSLARMHASGVACVSLAFEGMNEPILTEYQMTD